MKPLLWVAMFMASAVAAKAPPVVDNGRETLHEVLASLAASSLSQPSMANLVKAGMASLQQQANCFVIDESGVNRGELKLSCGLHEDRLPWPPTRAADAADLLVRASQLVDRKAGSKVKPLTRERVDGLCRAMANSVGDPWTAYSVQSPPNSHTTPGVELWPRDPSLVRSVQRASGALSAGLKAGDRLLRIGDQVVAGMSYYDVMTLLSGASQTTVKVRVQHEAGATEDLMLTRTQSYSGDESHQLVDDTLILRLPVFKAETALTVLRLLQTTNPARIVLDLRHNPGGLVPEAVAMLDLFLRDGMIAGVRSGPRRPTEDYQAHADVHDTPVPLAVLVDGSSASASELVALTLQQRRRAIILGEPTSGKGTVQRQITLPNGAMLKVTAAYYVGPQQTPLDERGIRPDVILNSQTAGTTMLDGGAALDDSWVLAALGALEQGTAKSSGKQVGAGPR
jgi:C-terminal peptidase prc